MLTPKLAQTQGLALLLAATLGGAAQANSAAGDAASAAAPVLASLPALTVSSYMGTWYQVAYFPNVFQKQCASDTTAGYRLLPDGTVEVTNRCRTADGKWDTALGRARPVGQVVNDQLTPAQLTVSFLPAWLQWLPVGRGSYWVIQRADDGRYAVISEPSRKYLWVLSRTSALSSADESAIRSRLVAQGFDLSRWTAHAQSNPDKPSRP